MFIGDQKALYKQQGLKTSASNDIAPNIVYYEKRVNADGQTVLVPKTLKRDTVMHGSRVQYVSPQQHKVCVCVCVH